MSSLFRPNRITGVFARVVDDDDDEVLLLLAPTPPGPLLLVERILSGPVPTLCHMNRIEVRYAPGGRRFAVWGYTLDFNKNAWEHPWLLKAARMGRAVAGFGLTATLVWAFGGQNRIAGTVLTVFTALAVAVWLVFMGYMSRLVRLIRTGSDLRLSKTDRERLAIIGLDPSDPNTLSILHDWLFRKHLSVDETVIWSPVATPALARSFKHENVPFETAVEYLKHRELKPPVSKVTEIGLMYRAGWSPAAHYAIHKTLGPLNGETQTQRRQNVAVAAMAWKDTLGLDVAEPYVLAGFTLDEVVAMRERGEDVPEETLRVMASLNA